MKRSGLVVLSGAVFVCVFLCSFAQGAVIYVNSLATGSNTGASWTNAFKSLQSGLNAARSGDEIWVAAGIYKPTKKVGGTTERHKAFQLKNGIGVYGGFSGTENARNQRDWNVNQTILSGDLNGDDNLVILPTEPTRQDNCYHVFNHLWGTNLNTSAILDGVTVTGGNGIDDYPYGGGMYNDHCSPTIINCTFKANTATTTGGGGILNYHSSAPVISNCTFVNNYAYYGGGIQNTLNSNPTIVGCVFSNNSSLQAGGGVSSGSDIKLVNCIFSNNSSNSGGGLYYVQASINISNCTFWGNSAMYGGGIYSYQSSSKITNSILWGNIASSGRQIYAISSDSPVVSYSDIQGGWEGEGNINHDPLFVDTANGNLRLQMGSLCIDAGSNDMIPAGIVMDMAGTPRIVDGNCDSNAVVDIGAYEYFLIGDLNFTCAVDVSDFGILAEHWLLDGCTSPDNCNQADIDHNGKVELADFIWFAEQWLQTENILPQLISPIAWWSMDETEGTLVGDSIGGHHGQMVNIVDNPWVAGHFGNALKLDGVDDYVEMAGYTGISGTSSRTCAAWIKTTASGKEQMMLSWGNSIVGQKWMFRLQSDGKPAIAVWGGYIQGSVSIADGQWHHVAAVLVDDGSPSVDEIKLYVDGVADITSTTSTLLVDTAVNQNVQIGSYVNIEKQYGFFNGLLDEVRIYDVALTGEQILQVAIE